MEWAGYLRRSSTGCVLLLLLIAAWQIGCVGSGTAVVTSEGIPQAGIDAGGIHGIPAPGGPGIDANIAVRESQYALNTTVEGLDFYRLSANSTIDLAAETVKLYSTSEPLSWAVYAVGGLTHDEVVYAVSIYLRAPLPATVFVGMSDWEINTWQWTKVDTASSPVVVNVPLDLMFTGNDGQAMVCVVAPTKEFVEIRSLEFIIDIAAPAPAGLTASNGTYVYAIELSWEDPADTFEGLEYEAIEVLRSFDEQQESSVIASLPSGTTTYYDIYNQLDNDLPLQTPVYYSVQTVVDGSAGPPAPQVVGSTGGLPQDLGFQAAVPPLPDRIVLNWLAQPDAQSYVLEYRSEYMPAHEELAVIEDAAVSSFEHTKYSPPGKDCEQDVIYYYRLRALFPTGEVIHADAARRRFDPPYSFRATFGEFSDKVVLYWDSSYGTQVNYEIFRDGVEEADRIAVVSNALTFEDTAPGKNAHEYWIRTEFDGDVSPMISKPEAGCALNDSWQLHSIDSEYRRGRYSSMVRVDGKPMVAFTDGFTDGPSDQIMLARALVAMPETHWDWDVDIIGTAEEKEIALFVLADRLAVYYFDDGLRCAVSSDFTPGGPEDWQSHLIDSSEGLEDEFSAMLYSGRLAVAYAVGNELTYARAQVVAPSSSADWNTVTVDNGYNLITNVAMFEIDGLPALSYRVYDLYLLRYARAITAEPTEPDDWQRHEFDDRAFSSYIRQLINAGGVPAVIYQDGAYLRVVQANSPQPSFETDWLTLNVFYHQPLWIDNCVATISNGTIAICFDIDESKHHVLCRAVSSSLTPAFTDDWAIDVLHYTPTADSVVGSLMEYAGGLALTGYVPLPNQGLVFAYLPPE